MKIKTSCVSEDYSLVALWADTGPSNRRTADVWELVLELCDEGPYEVQDVSETHLLCL